VVVNTRNTTCRLEDTDMRFLWFHLMRYPDLPADFNEKVGSIWVSLGSEIAEPGKIHQYYNDTWTSSNLLPNAVLMRSASTSITAMLRIDAFANLMARALSDAVPDAAICVMGSSLALYDRPTRGRRRFALIDWISGGRLSPGSGWHADGHLLCLRPKFPSSLRQATSRRQPGDASLAREQPFCNSMGSSISCVTSTVGPSPYRNPIRRIGFPAAAGETWQWCGAQDYVISIVCIRFCALRRRTHVRLSGKRWRAGARFRKSFRTAAFLSSSALPETTRGPSAFYKEPRSTSYQLVCIVRPVFVSPAVM